VADPNLSGPWPRPDIRHLSGRYVQVARLDAAADIEDLYDVSHRTEEFRALWRYLWNGPFESKDAMYRWLASVQDGPDPIFYTVASTELGKNVGMFSLLNIVPEMGRAEFGHIWYSPLVQRTKVNTEVTFLFLRCMFDDLHYRRVEWKCDNLNERSKRAALRLGFKYEGIFRKHMVVKGNNRDTAWFAMLDEEWPSIKASFETYLSNDGASLTQLNQYGKKE
jgi:RimJ/RimL family protein N-acetyltransferase